MNLFSCFNINITLSGIGIFISYPFGIFDGMESNPTQEIIDESAKIAIKGNKYDLSKCSNIHTKETKVW
jgi:hypothetical protein